jgi:WD40 repeat protein
MQFSPDGRYLATAGSDGVLRVWRVDPKFATGENSCLPPRSLSHAVFAYNCSVTGCLSFLHIDWPSQMKASRGGSLNCWILFATRVSLATLSIFFASPGRTYVPFVPVAPARSPVV